MVISVRAYIAGTIRGEALTGIVVTPISLWVLAKLFALAAQILCSRLRAGRVT